jgi:hypothetical protein
MLGVGKMPYLGVKYSVAMGKKVIAATPETIYLYLYLRKY